MRLRRRQRRELRALQEAGPARQALIGRLAATAVLGAENLATVARRQASPGLRELLTAVAADCAQNAAALRELAGPTADRATPFDLRGGRDTLVLDLHGFPTPAAQEELGAARRIAHVAAAAAHAGDVYRRAGAMTGDVAIHAIAERFAAHARALEAELAKLPDARAARKDAHRSAFLAAWKRLGLRSGAGFSRAVLYVLYWTVLLPFGLLSRGGRPQPAVLERAPDAPGDPPFSSQY